MSFVLIIGLILVAFALLCFLYAAAAYYAAREEEVTTERDDDWQWP